MELQRVQQTLLMFVSLRFQKVFTPLYFIFQSRQPGATGLSIPYKLDYPLC